MNDYTPESESDMFFWLSVFLALSLEHFEEFAETLHFPIEVSPDLQAIAKDFSLLAFSYLGSWLPEMPPAIPDDAFPDITDPRIRIWKYTFSSLSSKGYAEPILQWINELNQYHAQFSDKLGDPSEWDLLLVPWAKKPDDNEYSPLALSQSTINTIQLIVLRHYIKFQYFQIRDFKIKHWLKEDSWEHFAVKMRLAHAWLLNEVWFYLSLSQWIEILSQLTDIDIQILDAWGQKNMRKDRGNPVFSIRDLANELLNK